MQAQTTPNEGKATSARHTIWSIDPSHSSATFSVRHLMITNVRGEFQKLSGSVTYDPARPEATTVQATIDVASINTREPQRDAHLRSADFFDAETHPTLTFTSKALRTGDRGLELVGDLTIRGTTREVVLAIDGPTPEQDDPWGNVRIGASATTKIKRSEFGMTWNTLLETGGIAVADEVSISLDVSLVRQK
ncbi:MAG: YceI family protein [Labilithrix sp.]|nr:YceI family protein [Labilithrix sp.]